MTEKQYKMILLASMDNYICNILGDESAWMSWIQIVPDECTEDDLEFIADDEELWKDTCKLFGKLVEKYA